MEEDDVSSEDDEYSKIPKVGLRGQWLINNSTTQDKNLIYNPNYFITWENILHILNKNATLARANTLF